MSFNKRKLFQKIKQLYPKIQVQSKDFKDAAEEAFFTLLKIDTKVFPTHYMLRVLVTNSPQKNTF